VTPKRRDAEASWTPKGPHLRVMATRDYWLAVLTVGRAESIRTPPDHLFKRRSCKDAYDPLAPSSAHDVMSPGGVLAPCSSVRCASLSTCCPARSDGLGPADAAVPLHPIHPAARSTFGGRSSQSPQSLPCLPPPCQGSDSGLLRLCVPSEATRQRTPPGLPGDALHPIDHRWEPHQFTSTSLLCQVARRGSLFAPRPA
jgi:hypothetical protein